MARRELELCEKRGDVASVREQDGAFIDVLQQGLLLALLEKGLLTERQFYLATESLNAEKHKKGGSG